MLSWNSGFINHSLHVGSCQTGPEAAEHRAIENAATVPEHLFDSQAKKSLPWEAPHLLGQSRQQEEWRDRSACQESVPVKPLLVYPQIFSTLMLLFENKTPVMQDWKFQLWFGLHRKFWSLKSADLTGCHMAVCGPQTLIVWWIIWKRAGKIRRLSTQY